MGHPLSAADKLKLRVVELYNERKSSSVVAAELNLTLGQVAGIIYRARRFKSNICHGVVRPKLRNGAPEAQPKISKAKVTLRRRPKMFSDIEAVKEKRRRLRLVQSEYEVTFEQLETHHCRFPYGEPRSPDFRFCGKPRWEKHAYCEEHCAVVFAPAYFDKK